MREEADDWRIIWVILNRVWPVVESMMLFGVPLVQFTASRCRRKRDT